MQDDLIRGLLWLKKWWDDQQGKEAKDELNVQDQQDHEPRQGPEPEHKPEHRPEPREKRPRLGDLKDIGEGSSKVPAQM